MTAGLSNLNTGLAVEHSYSLERLSHNVIERPYKYNSIHD